MAREAVQEVCLVIQDILASHFIHLINPQEMIAAFCYKNFPNCVEAMNSTHISIFFLNTQAFISHKGYFSIILQDVVDCQDCFTHIFVSWAGSTHDAHVFCNSPLPEMMESRHCTKYQEGRG
ncbi:hypothetical protein Y1Q_0009841 [Alligator mississippiensis]|uniref:DDE Tnp4 domain-containing protein n=1 Tax=Alligator mississippiensis TaxID=8496 RepID=A0A151MX82_ALLMI|nr:hypothetical protein Y1Q_0009841 [Alligator mississippiensis]